MIRPSGAIYTGSMFSDGLYFANKARKSIGYTSLSGSYWAGGNNSKSLLAIFKVNVGNQKHIYKHDSSCYNITEKNLLPYNSVYAHGGADLRNDEFIVYNPNRCTIKYLVEIRK
ncbi:MAG: Poly(ADP-ribose) polymerase catalytic domain [Bacteriophage sp.]|nr:MAG: Poly(ADP-ribose) polymerase catalytic domain [Bacteriophage sp.]